MSKKTKINKQLNEDTAKIFKKYADKWNLDVGGEIDKITQLDSSDKIIKEENVIGRKQTPVYSGVLMYFPDAIREIARCSFIANEQHNPNTPMHWDRSKSGDELDALTRHLLEAGTVDTDGILHSTKVAWRALAHLQKELEGK